MSWWGWLLLYGGGVLAALVLWGMHSFQKMDVAAGRVLDVLTYQPQTLREITDKLDNDGAPEMLGAEVYTGMQLLMQEGWAGYGIDRGKRPTYIRLRNGTRLHKRLGFRLSTSKGEPEWTAA